MGNKNKVFLMNLIYYIYYANKVIQTIDWTNSTLLKRSMFALNLKINGINKDRVLCHCENTI